MNKRPRKINHFLILICLIALHPLAWAADMTDCPSNDGVSPSPSCPNCNRDGRTSGVNVPMNSNTNPGAQGPGKPDEAKKLSAVNVTPGAAELFLGQSRTFAAVATYSDNSTRAITGEAKWSGGEGNTFTAKKGGTFTITATYQGLSSSAAIIVKKVPTAISVSPAQTRIKVRESATFSATATFDDGSFENITAKASWSPGSAFTGTEAGTYAVTATYEGLSGAATVTVIEPVVTALSIVPSGKTIKINESVTFEAIATFDDGSTKTVTGEAQWSGSNPFFGSQPGTFIITASYRGNSGSAMVTVTGESYNPLDDPNLKNKDKPVDTGQVKQIVDQFQKGQPTGKGPKEKPFPTEQPQSYTGGDQKPAEQPGTQPPGVQPPYYPPYPPGEGPSPGTSPSDVGKDSTSSQEPGTHSWGGPGKSTGEKPGKKPKDKPPKEKPTKKKPPKTKPPKTKPGKSDPSGDCPPGCHKKPGSDKCHCGEN